MLFKYGPRLILYISLFFLVKKCNCTYISSGITTLNKFLYFSRISTYQNQSKTNSCSLNDGPNCYYTENSYLNNYMKNKEENIEAMINNDWITFFSNNSKKDNYENLMNNIHQQSIKYIQSISEQKDSEQNPGSEKLEIIMTFDDETTKKGMYLEKLMNVFYNEKLIAEFQGRLRLSSDDDGVTQNTEDKKNNNFLKYPSKLYGIIESEFVSITFRGKLFTCNYLYIRIHNEGEEGKKKEKEIQFYGYLGSKVVYGYTHSSKNNEDENWTFIAFPKKMIIDKLIISGPYEIDNIGFTFHYGVNVDPNDIYYMYNYQKTEKLIDIGDI